MSPLTPSTAGFFVPYPHFVDLQGIAARQIRLRRRDLGFTQGELAKVAGISPSTVGEIERGETDFRASTLEALAQPLRTRAAYLLLEGDEADLDRAIAVEEGRLEWLTLRIYHSGEEALIGKMLRFLDYCAEMLKGRGEEKEGWREKLKREETAQLILVEIEAEGETITLPARELGERIGRSRSTTWENLNWLAANRLIYRLKRQTGRGNGDTWGLTEKGERVIEELGLQRAPEMAGAEDPVRDQLGNDGQDDQGRSGKRGREKGGNDCQEHVS